MEAMFPVEKKADWRRKRKNRAGRMSERFRLRHIGWLFEEEDDEDDEGEATEEAVVVSVNLASIWVVKSPRSGVRGWGCGLGVGVGDGGLFGLWKGVVRKLWMRCSSWTQVSKVLQKTK